MQPIFAMIIPLSGNLPDQGLPPGFPGYGGAVDPGYGRPGFVGSGHPGNALPTPPVRPSQPIELPPGIWPPQLPPEIDNSLPPLEAGNKPIYLPTDPDLGIEQPIIIPPLPHGVALLIGLPRAQPKANDPAGTVPAILVQSGKRPVVVYVTGTPSPK
jgi:hypothetical protein